MVKEEVGCSVCHVSESGHVFRPFSELFDGHNNVLVLVTRWMVACHKIYAPFAKMANSDDRV
jgi:hypothetical protein